MCRPVQEMPTNHFSASANTARGARELIGPKAPIGSAGDPNFASVPHLASKSPARSSDPGDLRALDTEAGHQALLVEDEGVDILRQRR